MSSWLQKNGKGLISLLSRRSLARALDRISLGKHDFGMTGFSLYPITLTCPRCGRNEVMDAKQLVDKDDRPIKFEIGGNGSFWLEGPAPQTRADAIVRCACGSSFKI